MAANGAGRMPNCLHWTIEVAMPVTASRGYHAIDTSISSVSIGMDDLARYDSRGGAESWATGLTEEHLQVHIKQQLRPSILSSSLVGPGNSLLRDRVGKMYRTCDRDDLCRSPLICCKSCVSIQCMRDFLANTLVRIQNLQVTNISPQF